MYCEVYKYNSNNELVLDNDDSSIGNRNPFRYKSYYLDIESGLYYLNSRYYNSKIGRFITIDNINYIDESSIYGYNLYCYCGNNPVMYRDPEGTSTKWWEWALAGTLVVGLIVGAVLTGGTLIGAALAGAAIGAGLSVSTQAFSGELNWGQLALDTGVGAISGLVGASGISRIGAAFVGGAMGGSSSFLSQLIKGEDISSSKFWWKVAIGTAIGFGAGLAGGAGKQNVKASNSAPKVKKALDGINKVLAKQYSGAYSSARYAQATMTNVCNRFASELIKQQKSCLRRR